MELRVLRYFLMVAKEQSFTKAAEQLHITQPTLSRQLAALEDELGTKLFCRGGHSITLTDDGLLLKRRALEMIDLGDRIVDEFSGANEDVHGRVTVGCGEFAAVETLAEIIAVYKEKYPFVQFGIHTGTADQIQEMMNKGLVDVGLFLEPVGTEDYDYIRIYDSDIWVVGMRPDDPLADREKITRDDLIGIPIILPERYSVQNEIANWFGKDFDRLNIAYTSNLGTNAGILAMHGLGYPISVAGAAKFWRENLIIQKPLSPEVRSNTIIAWRRNIPYSRAVRLFIEEIKNTKI